MRSCDVREVKAERCFYDSTNSGHGIPTCERHLLLKCIVQRTADFEAVVISYLADLRRRED